MATVFVTDRQEALSLNCLDVGDAVDLVLRTHRAKAGEIAIHFVEPAEISALHQQYFGDPTPTDCISFPLNDNSLLMGDIFICPSIGVEYAREYRLDPHDEVLRYLVHALLHFLGFGDQTSSDRARMTLHENRSLHQLARQGLDLKPIEL